MIPDHRSDDIVWIQSDSMQSQLKLLFQEISVSRRAHVNKAFPSCELASFCNCYQRGQSTYSSTQLVQKKQMQFLCRPISTTYYKGKRLATTSFIYEGESWTDWCRFQRPKDILQSKSREWFIYKVWTVWTAAITIRIDESLFIGLWKKTSIEERCLEKHNLILFNSVNRIL